MKYDSNEDNKVLEIKSSISEDKIKDYKLIGTLGEGAFAKVLIARDKSKNLFAMKRIKKDVVVQQDVTESIRLEHQIMTQIDYPFLLSLSNVFESEK